MTCVAGSGIIRPIRTALAAPFGELRYPAPFKNKRTRLLTASVAIPNPWKDSADDTSRNARTARLPSRVSAMAFHGAWNGTPEEGAFLLPWRRIQ